MSLTPHRDDEEQGLWDELSHQQSREIEAHHLLTRQHSLSQHQDGFQARDHINFNDHQQHHHRWALARRIAQQAREETSRILDVFQDAIGTAWREHQERQALYQATAVATHARVGLGSSGNTNNYFLDEFGIPKEEGTDYIPLHQQQQDGRAEEDEDTSGFIQLEQNRQRFLNRSAVAANNLDVYFSSLYLYYYHRGLIPIVAKAMFEFISLFFTVFLSAFLCYIDWSALAKCTDEQSCRPFKSYIMVKKNNWRDSFLVSLYVFLFLLYAAFFVWSFFQNTLRQALAAKWVFEERLGISTRRLQGGAVDWDKDVVQKLQQLHASGYYRITMTETTTTAAASASSSCDNLDALVIAQRILRKENFMTAMLNRDGLIDLKIASLPGWASTTIFFSPTLEWSLYFCILNFMFNHKYQIRPAFYLDPPALRRRFVLCGVAHAVLLPFLLFFLLLHFVMRHAYDFKSTKQYFGPREWSLSSKWLFREFNELPHLFERRLAPSYQAADDYLALFGQNEIVAAVGRVLVFIAGSLGAVLFVFAAMNDAILLHVKIADWNLLWYAGMVGVVYSAGKAMIPNEQQQASHVRNQFAETDAALTNIAKHTHYYMETWKSRGSDVATHKAISSMFKYKAQLFATEVASVVLAPYILCVKLAQSAEAICEFIFSIKADLGGAGISGGGEVCGFATFDFDKFQDEAWEGRTFGSATVTRNEFGATTTLSESILRTGNVEAAARELPIPKTRHGKMEKSFFSFKSTHPSWKCSASGQHLVDRIEQYKREETAALSRERELHIQAATRQLETLARLEQRQQQQQQELHRDSAVIQVYDESHIPKTQAPADAGAGMVQHRRPRYHQQSHYVPPGLVPPAILSPPPPQDYLPEHANQSPSPVDDVAILPFAASSIPQQRSLAFSSSLSSHPNYPSALLPSTSPGLSLGLSSELRRILTLSTLDPDVSVDVAAASLMMMGETNDITYMSIADQERLAERQYLWLERYHAHLNSSQQQQRLQHRQSSSSSATFSGPATAQHNDDQSLGRSLV